MGETTSARRTGDSDSEDSESRPGNQNSKKGNM